MRSDRREERREERREQHRIEQNKKKEFAAMLTIAMTSKRGTVPSQDAVVGVMGEFRDEKIFTVEDYLNTTVEKMSEIVDLLVSTTEDHKLDYTESEADRLVDHHKKELNTKAKDEENALKDEENAFKVFISDVFLNDKVNGESIHDRNIITQGFLDAEVKSIKRFENIEQGELDSIYNEIMRGSKIRDGKPVKALFEVLPIILLERLNKGLNEKKKELNEKKEFESLIKEADKSITTNGLEAILDTCRGSGIKTKNDFLKASPKVVGSVMKDIEGIKVRGAKIVSFKQTKNICDHHLKLFLEQKDKEGLEFKRIKQSNFAYFSFDIQGENDTIPE